VSDSIRIEVAYAPPDRQEVVRLEVARGTTALEALELSGLKERFAELAGAAPALGVFGRLVAHDHIVEAGDRVEVYRPLRADPRVARRARARRER